LFYRIYSGVGYRYSFTIEYERKRMQQNVVIEFNSCEKRIRSAACTLLRTHFHCQEYRGFIAFLDFFILILHLCLPFLPTFRPPVKIGMNKTRYENHSVSKYFLGGFFNFFFFVLYSALLHLPPLRFHCADGCWDRIQDLWNWCIDSQTL
jgi:hypothetical protein